MFSVVTAQLQRFSYGFRGLGAVALSIPQ